MFCLKRILVILDDEEYQIVRGVKDRLGLTWDELFFQSVKAVDDALKEEGSVEGGEDRV